MSYHHFTSDDRTLLSGYLRLGLKQKDIAYLLGKDPASISRELSRNRSLGNIFGYHARLAQERTGEGRKEANQRFRKIVSCMWLQDYIEDKLKESWSPEQIAGRLRADFGLTIICHETIYQYIYRDKPKLKKYLRCTKGKYRRRYGTRKKEEKRKELAEQGKKRIDVRPEIVEKRARLGDFEGDLVEGKKHTGYILTYADRKSGYLLAYKVDRAEAEKVERITTKGFYNIPRKKKYTITYDNDTCFANYEMIKKYTGIDIYFAYPYHAWERGTNENTNGLLRYFFPKKTSFQLITQKKVTRAVNIINNRPRKRLQYLTPYEVFVKNCTLD